MSEEFKKSLEDLGGKIQQLRGNPQPDKEHEENWQQLTADHESYLLNLDASKTKEEHERNLVLLTDLEERKSELEEKILAKSMTQFTKTHGEQLKHFLEQPATIEAFSDMTLWDCLYNVEHGIAPEYNRNLVAIMWAKLYQNDDMEQENGTKKTQQDLGWLLKYWFETDANSLDDIEADHMDVDHVDTEWSMQESVSKRTGGNTTGGDSLKSSGGEGFPDQDPILLVLWQAMQVDDPVDTLNQMASAHEESIRSLATKLHNTYFRSKSRPTFPWLGLSSGLLDELGNCCLAQNSLPSERDKHDKNKQHVLDNIMLVLCFILQKSKPKNKGKKVFKPCVTPQILYQLASAVGFKEEQFTEIETKWKCPAYENSLLEEADGSVVSQSTAEVSVLSPKIAQSSRGELAGRLAALRDRRQRAQSSNTGGLTRHTISSFENQKIAIFDFLWGFPIPETVKEWNEKYAPYADLANGVVLKIVEESLSYQNGMNITESLYQAWWTQPHQKKDYHDVACVNLFIALHSMYDFLANLEELSEETTREKTLVIGRIKALRDHYQQDEADDSPSIGITTLSNSVGNTEGSVQLSTAHDTGASLNTNTTN